MEHDDHLGEDTVCIDVDESGETYKCLICGDVWHEDFVDSPW